jgi:hypothetical protein
MAPSAGNVFRLHATFSGLQTEAGVEGAARVADIVADNTAAIALNSPDVRPHVCLDVV